MDKNQCIDKPVNSSRLFLLSGLFFLSGTAGLILQVVWMYRLGLIFGNASYATAATLSSFFMGLAIGGWFLGRASANFKRPLLAYGFMEIGIAITALLLIPGIDFYKTHYASVVSLVVGNKSMLTLLKFFFSVSLLLLPSVLMGGTFPVLAQYVGNKRSKLASRATLLYAVNTIGAALGAFLAGFYLLSKYGVDLTYKIAIVLAASIGITALLLDILSKPYKVKPNINLEAKKNTTPKKLKNLHSLPDNINYSQFILLAFSSGLLALSAETIWTRMFAQVLQNSVYSFSAILVVFLFSLGFGGLISHKLVKTSIPPQMVLVILLSIGAITLGFSPIVFNALTNGLDYIAKGASWNNYLLAVFKLSFMVVFVPTAIIGAIFPFLLKAAPKLKNEASGKFVGKLVLLNSFGSTLGPIIAGFILLDVVGVWTSIKVIAISYGVLAFIITYSLKEKRVLKWMIVPLAGIIGVVLLANPPIVKLRPDETISDLWQSSDGVVSIVKSKKNIEMRLDNFYVLGDSKSILVEQMQAHVPLLLHPNPKKVLFLGMGTGITAGAALSHNVDQVIAVELVTNVIPAAKRYFSPWTNNLFNDDRVEIVADDARNFLLGSSENYDVIIGDLFTPWHAGTGSLYTIEHFKQAKKKLTPGGIFAQWLPLYQLTPQSFDIIAATFASVFPEVTLWRSDFSGKNASIALIGQEKGSRLDQEILKKNIVYIIGDSEDEDKNHMAGLFYLGNLNALSDQLKGVGINNDNLRTVEFKAPILTQQANAGEQTYVVKGALENLLISLQKNIPPDQDTYLADLPESEINYVKVGLLYYRYLMLMTDKKEVEANKILDQINILAPDFIKKPNNSTKQ